MTRVVIIEKNIMDAWILVCYFLPTEIGEISSLGRELLLEVVGVFLAVHPALA